MVDLETGKHTKSVPIGRSYVYNKALRNAYRKRIYYSFLSVVLVICLFQAFRGAYLNVAKVITLNDKLSKLENINKKAIERNIELKHQLKEYSSNKGIEALARDNLKMAGKDEVLVIINEPAKTSEQ